jgi:proteasome beta subunit
MQTESRSFADLVGFPPKEWAHVPLDDTHGTTVLALRYDEGVVILADRRATMGNLIMFDQADKIIALDDATVVAISGSFARSVEMTRFLKHSFKYYRRVVFDEMSLEGKLMEVSRAIAANMAAAMNGTGIFVPILAAYDKHENKFKLYFFDAAGARFENPHYACAGSGSERIRGIFEFLVRTEGHFEHRNLEKVLEDGLHMLDIAADLDSATGGFNKVLPAGMVLTRTGVETVDAKMMKKAADKVLKAARVN